MAELKGTKTHQNLKDAFAGESQANRRYLYFAKQADIEGYPDVGGLFRDTAEAETGHAHGHLDYLKRVGDPATDKPIGNTETSAPPLRVRPTSTPRCTRAWRVRRETRASMTSPSGSRPWRRLRSPTRAASKRPWTDSRLSRFEV